VLDNDTTFIKGNTAIGFITGGNPVAKLHVRGTGGYVLWAEDSATNDLINLNENGDLRIQGDTAIGFTSGANPLAKLHVRGGGATAGSTALLVTDGAGTPNNLLEVKNDGSLHIGGTAGFTGTGAYTNFTITNGIITAAS
jgi:hypothetical protein